MPEPHEDRRRWAIVAVSAYAIGWGLLAWRIIHAYVDMSGRRSVRYVSAGRGTAGEIVVAVLLAFVISVVMFAVTSWANNKRKPGLSSILIPWAAPLALLFWAITP